MPDAAHRGELRPPLIVLAEMALEPEGVSHQFIQVNETDMSIQALSTLQALEWLKTDCNDNKRLPDRLHRNRSRIAKLVSENAQAYLEKMAEGAPIGQENDLLRLLHGNEYSEEDINFVRSAFKTKDLFHKRKIDQLKKSILALKKASGSYHFKIDELIKLSKQIDRDKSEKETSVVRSAVAALAYSRERK